MLCWLTDPLNYQIIKEQLNIKVHTFSEFVFTRAFTNRKQDLDNLLSCQIIELAEVTCWQISKSSWFLNCLYYINLKEVRVYEYICKYKRMYTRYMI